YVLFYLSICLFYSSLSCHFIFFFLFFFFFFFQAEDGIRDFHVTGVQTCALPICYGLVFGDDPAEAERREHEAVAQPAAERPAAEIGRASCRERVEISVGAGAIKKKKKTKGR